MQSYNVPENSKGILLFAFNTDTVNYVDIAVNAMRLIKHTTDLPVALVTDNNIKDTNFDYVIEVENTFKNIRAGYQSGTQWRNGNRYSAYALSPFDTTLLVDTDYLMLDTNLVKLFGTVTDYNIFYNNNAIQKPEALEMGVSSLPFVWATGIVFKKGKTSEMLFDLVGRIQRNYSYYRALYNIRESNFRNDYAFAIANYMLNGYNINNRNCIPWNLITFNDVVTDIEIKKEQLIVRSDKEAYLISKQNLHIMDKDYLLSDNYKTFVDAICQ